MISFYGAGGLGLPERDYYTRTDAKSVETAAGSTWTTCARSSCWPASRTRRPPKTPRPCWSIETRLAKASLTITEQRDPQNLNHPTDVASFGKGADALFAGRVCGRRACARRRQSERHGAEVFRGVQRAAGRYADRPDQDLSALAPAARLRGNQPAGELRPGELELLRAHAERRGEAAGTLEALHQPRGSANWARRWARSTWRATFRRKTSSTPWR